jgi:hypothetical protein
MSETPVSLMLASGAGTLSGTLTKLTDTNGLASFNDLSIDQAGSKTLQVSAQGYLSTISMPFAIIRTSPVLVVQPTNTVVAFGWNTVSGLTYQVQYKDYLTQSNWINLGASITGSGGAAGFSDGPTNSQRFYRIVLLP